MRSPGQGSRLIALIVVVAASSFAAAPALGSADVSLTLKSTQQAKLISSGKAKVAVRAEDERRSRLRLDVRQGGERTKVTKTVTAKLDEGKNNLKLRLNDEGVRLVQSCISTKLEATAKSRGGKRLDGDAGTMKRDPAVCDGSTPVGVDLDDGRSLRPDHAVGRGVPLPVPERLLHPERLRAPTPACASNLNPRRCRRTRAATHIDPTDINTSDGFSPGALIVLHVPGHGHAGGVQRDGRRADHATWAPRSTRNSRSC